MRDDRRRDDDESDGSMDDHDSTRSDDRGSARDDDRPSTHSGEGGQSDGQREYGLAPADIDRLFDLLEELLEAEAVTDEQFDRLLAILEQAATGPGSEPEMFAELLSLLEALLLDPDNLDEVDVDRVLGLFEEALAGATGTDRKHLEDIFDVIEEGIRDPTGVEPEDIDRLQAGIRRSVVDLTDPAESFEAARSFSAVAEEDDREGPVDLFRIARLGAAMARHASDYSVDSGIRAGTRLAYAAANAESPAKLLTTTRAITLDELQQAGIDIGEEQAVWLEAHEESVVEERPLTREALEERGARLLSRSADVGRDEFVHPAFASILEQLSTDEARILRLLATDGPQGVIDIYDRQYLPPKRRRVARNLSMLGREAGCRIQRRTPVYVQNLQRLGIAEVSDEPIRNLKRYEVIEAQSHVEHARTRAQRPRSVYKRIQLTDLGVEFCELCFPFEVAVDGEGVAIRETAGRDE